MVEQEGTARASHKRCAGAFQVRTLLLVFGPTKLSGHQLL